MDNTENTGRMSARTRRQIENNFTSHPSFGDQTERYERIRDKAKELAFIFGEDCPESREKSLALTHLEEAVMWANAAIARNEKNPAMDGVREGLPEDAKGGFSIAK